jgi:hypothetical protein
MLIRSFWSISTTLTFLTILVAATSGSKEIEPVIAEFNSAVARNDAKRIIALFTSGGTYRVGTSHALTVAQVLPTLAPKRLPWDERTPLTISITKIEFPRPGTVIVEAIQKDTSSMLGDTRTWSCVFELVRVGSSWKISSYAESAVQRTGPAEVTIPTAPHGVC